MLPVRVKLRDSACEAAGREPLHYIPTCSANLWVKATDNTGPNQKTWSFIWIYYYPTKPFGIKWI